jgi:hypothetical protein
MTESNTGAAHTYATDYEEYFRAAHGSLLFGELDANRSPQEHKQFADAFYDSLREQVAADPATAPYNWRVVLLLIARSQALKPKAGISSL